jgi:hypothetical protein
MYGVNPREIWTGSTLKQLFCMAKSGLQDRKRALVELIYAFHTSNPKAFVQELQGQQSQGEAWQSLAMALGDTKAAQKMKMNAAARRFLEAQKNGR